MLRRNSGLRERISFVTKVDCIVPQGGRPFPSDGQIVATPGANAAEKRQLLW
jgi:hypothetical protein